MLSAVLVAAVAAGGTWLAISPSSPLKGSESTTTSAPEGEEPPGGDDPVALDVLGPGVAQPAVTGWFDLGDPIELASGTVGPEGGVIVAPDGLLIEVPPGAHPGPVGYEIRAQEILGHDFGGGLNPVSMMYTVDNGGGYADDAIWVEVPAAVPDGGFAMGFLYDPATGGLEALPLVGVDAGKVVVVTSHFSQFFVHGIDPVALTAIVAAQTAGDTLSGLGPTMLVATRFRPGVDDWPFTNYGSYVSPGGHCAGQALSAMWYFTEQAARGRPSLHKAFDNDGLGPTARWQDDRNGYRLASAVQIDYSWHIEAWSDLFQRWLQKWRLEAPVTIEQDIDLWQFAAFVTAMTITGEPQYVSIARLDEAGERRGHAMVVYGADTRGLWVADPNYPGRFRRIPWDAATSTLGPYFSGPNAADLGRRYDAITLLGKTSQVDWSRLGLRFTQLNLGVAGDDVFPGYTLMVLEPTGAGPGRWVLLDDGYTTTAEAILIGVSTSAAGPQIRITQCLDTDRSCPQPVRRMVGVELEEGENTIELYLEALADGDRWRYLDFARVEVHRAPALDVTVIPATQAVGPGEDASFTIEVANLGTKAFKSVEVEVGPGGWCRKFISGLPGVSTHRYDCTLTPPPDPGSYEYSVTASGGSPITGLVITRTVYTLIEVGEASVPPGEVSGYCGDICDIHTRLLDTMAREYELGQWIRLCAGGLLAPDDPECTDGVFREAQRAERYRLDQLADAIREEQWAFDEEYSITWDERMQCLCRCLPEIYTYCPADPG